MQYTDHLESHISRFVHTIALRTGNRNVREIPWPSFARLEHLMHSRFRVRWTTYTPAMSRLLFASGWVAPCATVVGAGTHTGFGFASLLRNRHDLESAPHCQFGVAIDVDSSVNTVARQNLSLLGHGSKLRVIDGDAVTTLSTIALPIGVLLIDVDDPVERKRGYADIFTASLPNLVSGAWILAHDAQVSRFAEDFEDYEQAIRNSGRSIFHLRVGIDECGVAITITR